MLKKANPCEYNRKSDGNGKYWKREGITGRDSKFLITK